MSPPRPAGVTGLALFCVFGALMASLAALTLLLPDTALQRVWRLNPEGYQALVTLGRWGIALMAVVAIACATVCVGLLRGAAWGRSLAITGIVVNLASDIWNALYRGDLRTLIGLPIGAAVIAYLLTHRVRAYFARTDRGPRSPESRGTPPR